MCDMLPDDVTFKVGHVDLTKESDLALKHSTETPGGFSKCTFHFCIDDRREILLGDKVEIYNKTWDRYPFIGRVAQVHKLGGDLDITCIRSTRHKVFTVNTENTSPTHPSGLTSVKKYTPGTPYQQALTDALQLTPDVFDGGISNVGGLQFVADSNDLGGQNAEQSWNYVSSLTNSLATPLLWHVRGSNGLETVVIDFQDQAPRYFIDRLDESQIDETYDIEAIITQCTVAWGQGQVAQVILSAGQRAIQIDRDKYVSASNTITRHGDAVDMAAAYLARLGVFRAVSTNITVRCTDNTIRSVFPLDASDDYPLSLIESGHGLLLMNRPTGRYYEQLKYVVGTDYDWDTEELTLRCGSVVDFGTQVEQIVDYQVNRLYNGPYTGPPGGNHPLSDSDLLPKVGPELPGDIPPSFSYGTPAFTTNDGQSTSTQTKYDKVIHPDLIADEGIEINYTFDVTTLGWKGGTYSIPGELTEVKYSLWLSTATNGLQKDDVVFEIYTRRSSEIPVFLQKITISNQDENTVPITPTKTLPDRKSQLVFKVITAATTAEIINVTLHGKKHYPGLKV